MANNQSTTFPRNLLNDTRRSRLKYFRAFTIKHPLLVTAYEELRCAIRDSNPGSIIFLCGPPGAGKTTLLERLEKYLSETLLIELEKDREQIPVATVQLETPTSGSFDWKDYFKWLLIALEEPLVDHKRDVKEDRWTPSSNDYGSESNRQLILSERPATRALRFAAVQTLRRRRPLAVLVDDAQYLGILSSGRKLLDQLNTIKSLADKSLTTHVLCGTYELIPFRNLNGQLSRRSIDVHFGRYHVENEMHRQQFINVLYTFQRHLPLHETPDLVSRWDYFYERSLGCVGVLKDWLTRSLALALEEENRTLTLKYLERRALSVSQCATMLREAIIGEKELEEREGARLLLRRDLGLEAEPQTGERKSPSLIELDRPANIASARRKRRAGRRNPVRDKIGVK